jgi:hypothetical protein
MIPRNADTTVLESNMTGTVKSFTIEANGKAFRTLVDKLYSDKPGAIVRELCSNAFDSHVAAGKADVPFEVTVPTALNPVFGVRDFGTGMDHETVTTLYTTLFGSSKESTNDQVGMLGLGSKSPFSYTDQFAIRCYDGTRVRSYLAFIENSGVPALTLAGEEDCSEPQGVEVKLSIKHGDYHEFARAARRFLNGFFPVPAVEGMNFAEPEEILHVDNVRILLATSELDEGTYIRQGCVIYPISKSSVLQNSLRVHRIAVVIDVPIGSIDVTASREDFSYDEQSIVAVRDAITDARASVISHIQDKLDACSSVVDASFYWYDTVQNFGLARNTFNYRGAPLIDSIDVALDHDPTYASRFTKGPVFPTYSVPCDHRVYIERRLRHKFIVIPTGSKGVRTTLTFNYPSSRHRDDFLLVGSHSDMDKIKTEARIPDENIINFDDLPKKPKEVRQASTTPKRPKPTFDLSNPDLFWANQSRSKRHQDSPSGSEWNVLSIDHPTLEVKHYTPAEVRKLGLPESRHWSEALSATSEKYKDVVLRHRARSQVVAQLDRYPALLETVMDHPIFSDLGEDDDRFAGFMVNYWDVDTMSKEVLSTIHNTYPLLFSNGHDDEVAAYIAWKNSLNQVVTNQVSQ